MRHFNKLLKQLSLLYFAVLGLLIFLPFAPWLILLALLSVVYPKLMNAYFFLMLMGIRFYIWVSPIKFKMKNLGELSAINQKECVIISNHRSHLDMFLYLSQVYKVRAVANAYLLKIPVLGQVLWMSGHFVLKPGDIEAYKRALQNIMVAFKRQDKVLFFAEYHRCEPGFAGIKKFHMTPFQIARENKIPIIPVVLSGTDDIWPRGSMAADFSRPVSIKALSAIDPNSFESSALLASHIHNLMEAELKVMAAT